jgi:hypothetical protein
MSASCTLGLSVVAAAAVYQEARFTIRPGLGRRENLLDERRVRDSDEGYSSAGRALFP